MTLDPSYNQLNHAEREHLAAILRRLTDADLARPLDNAWTVGAALAHIAFWDRWGLAQLQRWARDGAVSTPAVDSALLNDAALPQWLALPPDALRREVLDAAEAVDREVERLSPELVRVVAAERPRTLQRFNHRRAHIADIEGALAG